MDNLPKPPDGCILHPMIKTRLDDQKHLAISRGQTSPSMVGGGRKRLGGNPPSPKKNLAHPDVRDFSKPFSMVPFNQFRNGTQSPSLVV